MPQDDLGKVTNLAPDERARIALQQLPRRLQRD